MHYCLDLLRMSSQSAKLEAEVAALFLQEKNLNPVRQRLHDRLTELETERVRLNAEEVQIRVAQFEVQIEGASIKARTSNLSKALQQFSQNVHQLMTVYATDLPTDISTFPTSFTQQTAALTIGQATITDLAAMKKCLEDILAYDFLPPAPPLGNRTPMQMLVRQLLASNLGLLRDARALVTEVNAFCATGKAVLKLDAEHRRKAELCQGSYDAYTIEGREQIKAVMERLQRRLDGQDEIVDLQPRSEYALYN